MVSDLWGQRTRHAVPYDCIHLWISSSLPGGFLRGWPLRRRNVGAVLDGRSGPVLLCLVEPGVSAAAGGFGSGELRHRSAVPLQRIASTLAGGGHRAEPAIARLV